MNGLIIAEIDGTINEIEDVFIPGFPHILFYSSSNKKIEYRGERTIQGLKEFLRGNS